MLGRGAGETTLPGITVGESSVSEGNPDANDAKPTLIVTISLAAASTRLVTVQYATADGTAVPESDFVAAAGMHKKFNGRSLK